MTIMTRRATAPRIASERADGWRDHAVCADRDPEMFTPELSGNHVSAAAKAKHYDAILDALRVCGTCPEWVRAECLAEAYATGDQWTIRGGTTGQQRVRARRREIAEAVGSDA